MQHNARILEERFSLSPGAIECLDINLMDSSLIEDDPKCPEPVVLRANPIITTRWLPFLHQNGRSLTEWMMPESITGQGRVCRLDHFFENIKIDALKMDAEGCDLTILRGGAKVIQRDRPLMTLCIYHSPLDLFAIPLLVKQLVPEYRIFIRHHSPKTTETVLYAVL